MKLTNKNELAFPFFAAILLFALVGSVSFAQAAENNTMTAAVESDGKATADEENKEQKNNQENNLLYSATPKERELLAKAVYSEARGEPFEGQIAVAAVILNRLKDQRFPDNIQEIIFQPRAFTAVDDGQFWLTPDSNAYKAVEEALAGKDPTGGALYYYNPAIATSTWIFNRPVIKKIGRHVFAG
ncbi:MAG: cell wall hydrolase [Dethiobacteria bacterium]|nr:spore cortex-lytic protein [Bacillota bacterium]